MRGVNENQGNRRDDGQVTPVTGISLKCYRYDEAVNCKIRKMVYACSFLLIDFDAA